MIAHFAWFVNSVSEFFHGRRYGVPSFMFLQNPFRPHWGHFTTRSSPMWSHTDKECHFGWNSVPHCGQRKVWRMRWMWAASMMTTEKIVTGIEIAHHETVKWEPNQLTWQDESWVCRRRTTDKPMIFLLFVAVRLLYFVSGTTEIRGLLSVDDCSVSFKVTSLHSAHAFFAFL